MKKWFLLIFVFHYQNIGFSQQLSGEKIYSFKELGEMLFYGVKEEWINVLDFQPGDTIADIGAGDGKYTGMFALYFDDLHFYVEDISAKKINERKLKKLVRKNSKIKGSPLTCTFTPCVGTIQSTNLPDNTFDKIIMKASFHEFTFVDEMLTDMNRKLKPGGKVIMIDGFSYKDEVKYCAEGHKGYKIEEVKTIMKKHGFYLTSMRNPESNVPNYSNTLVFERNEKKSEIYLSKVKDMQVYAEQFKSLAQIKVAGDTIRVNQIGDSLNKIIDVFQTVYPGTQSWIKGIGIKWNEAHQVLAALNVFKLNARLFPSSFDTWYWLGREYLDGGQSKLALLSLEKSYMMNPQNIFCKQRIDMLKKNGVK